MRLALLLMIAAGMACGEGESYNPVLAKEDQINLGAIATNYLDRIETDIKYAKQLRDAGYLGASIDVLIEAMQSMLLRIAKANHAPVVVTNQLSRYAFDKGFDAGYALGLLRGQVECASNSYGVVTNDCAVEVEAQ